MSGASTHFKLGIFTVLALLALLAASFGLGWRGVKSDTIRYHSYFNESVQGLEVGAPVKYRGVRIGGVEAVQIAPDRKHVDVTLELSFHEAHALGLAAVTPEVRAQLGTQGITGVKFVDIDFFDPKTNPPPELPFSPAANYIPARASLLKGIEDNLESVSQRLPELVDVAVATMHRLETILTEVHDQRIPERVAKAVDDLDGTVGDLRGLLRNVDRAHLPDKAAGAIEDLSTAVGKMNLVLDGVGGDGGLVASTRRASDSIGELGRTTTGSAADLQRTLRDLDDAARAIRELAESIDRDPDMLLKGRAKAKKP